MTQLKQEIYEKCAYVEVEGSIEDFLDFWEGNEEDKKPTQEDYDEWLKDQMWAALCSGCFLREQIQFTQEQ